MSGAEGAGGGSAGEVRITDPRTGGQKGQKPERYDLFPFDALDEVARVYGIGAKKYADDNWLRGYSWRLSLGAMLRHIARFACGEDRDPETGCLHLAHAVWHGLTMITFRLRGLGTDDRAKVQTSSVPGPARVVITAGMRFGRVGTLTGRSRETSSIGIERVGIEREVLFQDGQTGYFTANEYELVQP